LATQTTSESVEGTQYKYTIDLSMLTFFMSNELDFSFTFYWENEEF